MHFFDLISHIMSFSTVFTLVKVKTLFCLFDKKRQKFRHNKLSLLQITYLDRIVSILYNTGGSFRE